jgi:hypothetical protein
MKYPIAIPTLILALASSFAASVFAQAAPSSVSSSTANTAPPSRPPLWELGALNLNISQQAYPGSNHQIHRSLILPTFIYRGEHLRSDRDATGYRAIKTPRYEADVSFAGAFGPGDDVINARIGMPKLGTLVEFGPRLKIKLSDLQQRGGWELTLPVRGVFDLRDSLNQRGLKFEPTLSHSGLLPAGWVYSATAGLVFADKKLSQTFYGVEMPFVTPTRQAFEAQGGFLSTKLGLNVSKRISPDWRFFAFSRLESIDGGVNQNSPLAVQKVGTSVGFGISYTWKRSSSTADN